jgi:uncharacterized RDD family membrane protein YckC
MSDDPERRAQASAAARVHGPPDAVAPPPTYAGAVTRTIAFALDAAIVNLTGIVVGIVAGLCLSILELPDTTVTILVAIGGVLYVVWGIAYFVAFWSTTGQTPGSRVMRIRVQDARGGGTLRARRALMRFVGLTLAAIPLGAGFVPILISDRRRGFQDWLGRSVVVHTGVHP